MGDCDLTMRSTAELEASIKKDLEAEDCGLFCNHNHSGVKAQLNFINLPSPNEST